MSSSQPPEPQPTQPAPTPTPAEPPLADLSSSAKGSFPGGDPQSHPYAPPPGAGVGPNLFELRQDKWGRFGAWCVVTGALLLFAFLPLKLTFMTIGLELMLLGLILTRAPFWRAPAFWWGAAFSGWQILSVIMTPEENTIRRWGMAYIWLVIPCLWFAFAIPLVRKWSLRLFAAGLSLSIIIAFLQFFVGFDPAAKPFRVDSAGARLARISGMHGGHPLSLSFTFGIFTIACLGWPSRGRWHWLAATASSCVCLFTQARSTIAALIIVVFLTPRPLRGISLQTKIALGLFITAITASATFLLRPASLTWSALSDDARWVAWKYACVLIAERPLFGCGGAEGYTALMRNLVSLDFNGRIPPVGQFHHSAFHHAHNSLLAAASEHGLATPVLFIAFLVHFILSTRIMARRHTNQWRRQICLSIIIFTVAASTFENVIGDSESQYCILVALAALAACLRNSTHTEL